MCKGRMGGVWKSSSKETDSKPTNRRGTQTSGNEILGCLSLCKPETLIFLSWLRFLALL